MRSSTTDPGLRPGSALVVLGTRPEIIKLAPVVQRLGPAASIVHTGQHFDEGLSSSFFAAFRLPEPLVQLGVGGSSRGTQIGRIVTLLDEVVRLERPDVVIIQGDTNSAAAGAIAANACDIPLLHVEAGLRSHDRRMPEEHNRVIADHLADLCAAPTAVNRSNLRAEGVADDRIVVTGNTIVESVAALLPSAERRQTLLEGLGLVAGEYILSTFHRPENVDDPVTLHTILEQLASMPVPVMLPLHPRTATRLKGRTDLAALVDRLHVVEPVGYEDFLGLAAEAALLVSDSGGLQEEASILKRPMIVVRRSTERPEVIGTFAERVEPGPAMLAQASEWLSEIDELHARLAAIPTPYGDGSTSEKTVAAIPALIDA